MIFLSIKQGGKGLKNFVREIKNALVNSNQIAESNRQKIALKVFLKGIDDENLAKAVKIKKFKSIDKALKLASTIKLTDNSRVNAFNQNGCDANLKTILVEIGK